MTLEPVKQKPWLLKNKDAMKLFLFNQYWVLSHTDRIWNTVNGVHTFQMQCSLVTSWAPFQYPITHLIGRSRKGSKQRDLYLELYDRSEILQAPQQQCCRCACQISKRCDNFNYQSHGFESLWDLAIRHLVGYWNRALVDFSQTQYKLNNWPVRMRQARLLWVYLCTTGLLWL